MKRVTDLTLSLQLLSPLLESNRLLTHVTSPSLNRRKRTNLLFVHPRNLDQTTSSPLCPSPALSSNSNLLLMRALSHSSQSGFCCKRRQLPCFFKNIDLSSSTSLPLLGQLPLPSDQMRLSKYRQGKGKSELMLRRSLARFKRCSLRNGLIQRA